MDIIDDIRKSGAYGNAFFRHCRDSAWMVTKRDNLIPFAKNWNVVTRKFWHATCGLVGVLGAQGDDELLPAILKIAAEDGGLSGGAVNGIFGPPHHKLFQQMFWEREVVWFEEPYYKAPLEKETDRLISTFSGVHARTLISRTLGNDPLIEGLATVIVVETIALEIIKAMEGLFLTGPSFPSESPSRPYKWYPNSGYLDLHSSLEVEHAREMGEVSEIVLGRGDFNHDKLRRSVDWSVTHWARFWRAMDRITYG
ncbi:MAG: hypothetical protein COU33_03060 [Candidatus Magasanikbacteria bacterium CG10_big_fil_rev_8_21_14_0_10_43_6]|uniref:Uncharacterized protein n=1 Tax=Candidatus Magasanikbacteria bacterium CG10_big_fil_rev_8_21_14_0_10_43_6 TaxID=1974650 RepID=A0A2M6W0Y1_9BACT|nr:MAG: hypothetical protein COU33_03060 [Candidatus Magasanikbacteria bacterium CG10_big_fil_rev_8_21_14_0_10_43_6]